MSTRLRRIRDELVLAVAKNSGTKKGDMDSIAGGWVLIYDFDLPRGYNYSSTDILVVLPPGYPETPPDWFYLDPALRRTNGSVPHFFDVDNAGAHPDGRPHLEGWAAGCIHVVGGWKPSISILQGHSLLTVCKLIHDALVRWSK